MAKPSDDPVSPNKSILGLGIIIFLLVCFYFWQNKREVPLSITTPIPTTIPTSEPKSVVSDNWKIYANTEHGFSFSYPNNYQLTPIPLGIELVQDINLDLGQRPTVSLKVIRTEKTINSLLSDVRAEIDKLVKALENPTNPYYGKKPPRIDSIEKVNMSQVEMTKIERYLGPWGPEPNLTEYYLVLSPNYIAVFSARYGTYNPNTGQDGTAEKEALSEILTTLQFLDKKKGDVDEIQRLLDRNNLVQVIVGVKGNQFTSPEYQESKDKKKKEVKKAQDNILRLLTDKDIQNVKRLDFIPFFAGSISQSGFEKLINNENIVSIKTK